jgi:hypothetical protein
VFNDRPVTAQIVPSVAEFAAPLPFSPVVNLEAAAHTSPIQQHAELTSRPLSTAQLTEIPRRLGVTPPHMLSSLRAALIVGASLAVAQTAVDPNLVGTWSTKSNSTFTGPVCLSPVLWYCPED